MKILVIEHEANTGVHRLGQVLREAGAELDLVGELSKRPVPETLDGYDALIVMGGTPGPSEFDVAPWLKPVHKLVREAIDKEIPHLGVCLGGQILAEVAGGKVAEAEQPELGLKELKVTTAGKEDPLVGALANLQQPIKAMQWHFLEVKQLPEGATPLLESDACAVQAFRVGQKAWGLQFHLEADGDTAAAWSSSPGSPEDVAKHTEHTPAQLVDEVRANEERMLAMWREFAHKWLELAQRS